MGTELANDEILTWPNLAQVKPGDIIYYDHYDSVKERRVGDHITLVQDVRNVDGNGEIALNEILLIESTYGTQENQTFGNVIKIRTIETYHSDSENPRNWIIVRLK